jgi:hypothetical protein
VGVAKGVAPVAVTTMAPPGEAFTIADDCKKIEKSDYEIFASKR